MQKDKCKSGLRGRGAVANVAHRFESVSRQALEYAHTISPKTQILPDTAKTIISRNQSPDIPFSQSINPYRGCEHGCAYCYARATHAYLELSPGLDFETILYAKHNAPELLINELTTPSYQCGTIALGNNTDAYQPIERKLNITGRIMEIFERANHPVSIVTKSSLILRDIDVLTSLAGRQLIHVAISLTTLDHSLAMKMEPRAVAPGRRLQTIEYLSQAGIPVSVLLAPIIPGINDEEIEEILHAAKQAGASHANFVMLRLPHEVKDVFFNWLGSYFPLRKNKIKNKLLSMHNGAVYRAEFGARMRGSGEYAKIIQARFKLACKKAGLARSFIDLRTDLFSPHLLQQDQLSLF